MSQLLIRNLDDTVRDQLRKRAARHGWSVAEEVRSILRAAAASDDNTDSTIPLGSRVSARFRGLGLTEDLPELRGGETEPADFS
jgi:plasmid stability protein